MDEPREADKRPHTRYGLYIARVVTINTIMLMFGIIYSNTARKYQIIKIEDSATIARAKAEVLEQQLLDFMERTVKRMDALQDFNQTLNVPKIVEPQPPGKRELSNDELQRPLRPSPAQNPTPTATPKPRQRVVVKYKRAPTPKPWFHW